MDINEFKYERDEYYTAAVMWAVIAAACLYYGWEPVALAAAGAGLLHVLIGAGVSIWISHK